MIPQDDETRPLRETADADVRALIEASDAIVVPDAIQEGVRNELARQLDGLPAQRIFLAPRWAVVLVLVLMAGTALAVAVVATFSDSTSAPVPAEPQPQTGVAKENRPTPLDAPELALEVHAAPPAPSAPSAGAKKTLRVSTSTSTPISTRARAAQPDRPLGVVDWPLAKQAEGDASVGGKPTGKPARQAESADFLLDWTGRRQARLSLKAGANGTMHLAGVVNGTRVQLEVGSATLTGHIGEFPVNLWFRGDLVSGAIRGHDVDFAVLPIEGGYLARGNVPGHTVRVELTTKGLSWFPGCEERLPSVEPNVFAGTCARGERARVTIPPGLASMPYRPRMVVLGILLSERDPEFDLDDPRLFPPLGQKLE